MWISEPNILLIAFSWRKRPEKRPGRYFCSQQFTTYLNHSHLWAPHYRTPYVWLLHLGIYIHQRKLMDEFHMCFPGVCGMFPFLDWGKCSVQLLGIEYLRCQCFFFYLITSPASSSHSMFNNNLKKTPNGLKWSLFFKVDTLWRRLL